MRRSIALVLAVTGVIGVVGSATAAGSPAGSGAAPDKTSPTTTPVGVSPAVPTSAWVATTAPTTVVPATLPTLPTVQTVVPTTSPDTATVATTAGFDGLAFLTEAYAAVNSDPLTLIDVAEQIVIINSPADLFLAHLLSVTMTNEFYGGPPTPIYTVAADGKGVSVCGDAGVCDTFADFVAPTGLLESFTLNGVSIGDSTSGSIRRQVVESLSVDSVVCLKRIDGALSCAVLMTSDGASAVVSWERAVFAGRDGQQFAPDLAVSAGAPSITDGDFGSVHVVFPGAPLDGELSFPVVTGVSGTESIVTIPVAAL